MLRYMTGNNLNEYGRYMFRLALSSTYAYSRSSFYQQRSAEPHPRLRPELGYISKELSEPDRYLRRIGPLSRFATAVGSHAGHLEAASFGYRRSEHRPLGLTEEQSAALRLKPEYRVLEEYILGLDRNSEAYRTGKKELRATPERPRYAAIKKDIGKKWTEAQALKNIEGQLYGTVPSGSTSASIARSRNTRPMSPAQQSIINALYTEMVDATLEGQFQRRTVATRALTAYYAIHKPLPNKLPDFRSTMKPQPPH